MDDLDDDWKTEEQTTSEYFEGGKGNVGWILEKGINLGKMVVVTGFMIASAPVVLPPILVLSAIGFTCSVPFGLGYTGYACTLNLMSKLLPMPTAYPVLEYDQKLDDERGDRKEWEYQIVNHDYMEEEEREQMDDLRAGVEERIELVKNENEVPREEESTSQAKRQVEMLPKEEEWGVTELKVEGEGYILREKPVNGRIAGDNRNDAVGREEVESKCEETIPTRKDGKDEELKPTVERVVKISGEHNDRNIMGQKENIGVVATRVVGESNKNQTAADNEEEDIKRGSVGLLEKIKDEGIAEDAKKTKNKKKKKNKKKTSDGTAEMAPPDVEDQNVISKNVEENRESGPEKRTKLEDLMSSQGRPTTSYPLGETEETSGIAGRSEAGDRDARSEVDSGLPSEKDVVDQTKIWEQIDALRTIVGYKGTPHRSSIEEVKALYVFAGVELPSSVSNEADLAELSNKLRFLMSVVGVK